MEDIYCFAGNPLDRASERRRDTEWVASLLADPAARILPLRDLRPLTRDDGSAGARLAEGGAVARADRARRDADLSRSRRRGAAFRDRCERRRSRSRGGKRGVRRAHPGAAAAGRRGGDPRRGALADRLARAAPLLRPVRLADPRRIGRLGAALPGVPRVAFPAHRSGRHHAGGTRRIRAARPQPAARRQPLFVPCRVHGAGRDAGGGRSPRDTRGIRRSGSAACAIWRVSPGRFRRA